ncbi:MAG: hypothetical protein JXR40_06770 [Pontiellaceae bacterium]|nr:hypothetical protein [Pontiellaceae bacterium]
MKKTYISSLMIAMVAGSTAVLAQSDDVFAAFDKISDAAMPPVVAETDDAAASAAGEMQMQSAEQILMKGIAQYENADYDAAKMAFEIVLAREPYNGKAMDYLSRTYARIKAINKNRRDLTRAGQIAEIEQKWVLDDNALLTVPQETEEEVLTETDIAKQKMVDRLKETIIAAVEFNGDLSIQDAVIYLTEVCRRDGENVNMIVLGLRGSDGMDAGYQGNNIRLSVENMSLYDTLAVITEMANLQFEVDENAVYIMPYDYERDVNMEEATIKVSKSVGLKLAEYADAPAEEDDVDAGGIFGAIGGGSVDLPSGPVDLTDYIMGLNINCPRRSVATYTPDSNEVTVYNTAANIKKIRKRLDAIQKEIYFEMTQQVKIEAKFVEFSEGALKEVGLDWIIKGTGSVAGFNLSNNTPFGTTYVDNIAVPAATGVVTESSKATTANSAGLFTGGSRNSQNALEAVTSGILSSMGNGGVIPAMIFDRGDVSTKLSMLEQEGTADVLSCPSVTTMSGEEATIRVVEIHRYPQDYDVETGQRTAPIVKPQDWEDIDLGVVLRVMPDINDNGTITMKLEPEIRKFKGFEEYAVAVNSYLAESTTSSTDYAGDGSKLFAQMPYFEIRSVSTRVTVADSHTVVMGGLIDERTETFRDQVPILGDLPYLGKLFRHEGTRSEKKNLVIYVKPTQVDVRGMSLAESEMALQASL